MARNTDLADVNEIYTALVLNGGKFPDTASETQYERKLKLLTEQQGIQQIGRATVMAKDFFKVGKETWI